LTHVGLEVQSSC